MKRTRQLSSNATLRAARERFWKRTGAEIAAGVREDTFADVRTIERHRKIPYLALRSLPIRLSGAYAFNTELRAQNDAGTRGNSPQRCGVSTTMMNRSRHLLRWWTVVGISALVCVAVALLAANLFPDQTWNALNKVRELGDSSLLFTPKVPPNPHSNSGSGMPQYGDPIVARLATVDRFAFGGIGVAGVTSQGERDYELLLSRPSALALFEELYREGNLQGKSYALVGIHRLDPAQFKELAAPLHGSIDEVITQSGCIVGREPFREVVRRIEKEQVVVKFGFPPRK